MAAGAQQKKLPLIGVYMIGSRGPQDEVLAQEYYKALAVLGWTPGKTVRVEVREAGGDAANIERSAAELVALKPDVILASGQPSVVALKKATQSIPIVFALAQDPVGTGLVASLARPGGNITGFTYINPELIGKWRGLLAQVAPSTKRAGLFFNPTINPQYYNFLRGLGPAAIDIVASPVQSVEELRAAMAELGSAGGGAAIMVADDFVYAHGREAASFALQYRLPTISVFGSYVDQGGLMSYGPDISDILRRCASYIDRILRGGRNPPSFRCNSRTSSCSE